MGVVMESCGYFYARPSGCRLEDARARAQRAPVEAATRRPATGPLGLCVANQVQQLKC